MKKKNMFAKTAAAVAISAVALSGCSSSNNTDTPKPSGTQSSSEATQSATLTADSAAKFVSEYYAGWFEESDTDLYTTLQNTVTEIVGEPSLNTVDSDDPIAFFNNLPEEKQLELAEKVAELNKNSSFYDMSQLTLAEKSVLNIMVVSISSIFGNGESITVSADASKIVVDGNTATVPFSALTVKYGDTESPALADSGGFDLPLVAIDGEWKVDGKKFLDFISTSFSGDVNRGSIDSVPTGSEIPASETTDN